MLPLPSSTTPDQLPVNVLRLTVARDPANTVKAAEPCSGRYSPPVSRPTMSHSMLATLPTKRQFSIGNFSCRIDRGAGRLRAVVAEDAVAEERGVLHLSKVFDRDAAAGTGVVLVDLDVLDRGIGSRVDLDAAAVGIEERGLAQVVGFNRRLVARAGREVLGAVKPRRTVFRDTSSPK